MRPLPRRSPGSTSAFKHAFTDDGPWRPPALERPAARGRGAWLVAVAALAIGGGLLFAGQPSLARVHEVELAFAEGRPDDALRLLASSRRGDFPPHWAPPPSSVRTPDDLLALVEAVEHAQRWPDTPAWVRAAYARTLCDVDYSHSGPLAKLERADPTVARAVARRVLGALGSFGLAELPASGVPTHLVERWLRQDGWPGGGGDVGATTSAGADHGGDGGR